MVWVDRQVRGLIKHSLWLVNLALGLSVSWWMARPICVNALTSFSKRWRLITANWTFMSPFTAPLQAIRFWRTFICRLCEADPEMQMLVPISLEPAALRKADKRGGQFCSWSKSCKIMRRCWVPKKRKGACRNISYEIGLFFISDRQLWMRFQGRCNIDHSVCN